MSSASRISASGISLAPASTIRMASSVPETTRSRSAVRRSSSFGLTTKLPSILPIRTAPTGSGNGMLETISAAEAPFMARMSYGHDMVDRQRDRDELRLAVPALGEERAQRAVDHAGDEGALLAGAALALEEGSGDLARGVHALLDIHRQREEVDVTRVAGGCGAQHHRLAGATRPRSRKPAWRGAPSRTRSRFRRPRRRPDSLQTYVPFTPALRCAGPLHLVDASVSLRTMVVATDTLAPYGRPHRRLRGHRLHGPAGGRAPGRRRRAPGPGRPLAERARRARGAPRRARDRRRPT